MSGMEQLIADLKVLVARHASSPGRDFGALIGNLNAVITQAEANAQKVQYLYRHHLEWDDTWLDLEESYVGLVLKQGHTVERRRVLDAWEPVTEAPKP